MRITYCASSPSHKPHAFALGETVVHEERSVDNLWDRKMPIISEGASFDPNRQADFAEGSAVKTEVDPLAFLAGRVEVKYGGNPAQSKVADLNRYINRDDETVTSTTGELKLNYGIGLCTMNAPKAQGATGFLKVAGPVKLNDLTIQSGNEYATVMVVALDDNPLSQSQKVLVQVGTVMRPTGWSTKPAQVKSKDGNQTYIGQEIVSTGKLPWQVVNTDVTLTLKNPNLKKATQLDTAGFAGKTVAIQQAGGVTTIKLPSDTLYLVLE